MRAFCLISPAERMNLSYKNICMGYDVPSVLMEELVSRAHKKRPRDKSRGLHNNSGNDLLSHTIARVVPSALEGLTAEFGMGSGVTPPLWSPEVYILTSGSPAGAGSSSRRCGREVSGLLKQSFLLEHPANIVINKDLAKSHDLLVPLD